MGKNRRYTGLLCLAAGGLLLSVCAGCGERKPESGITAALTATPEPAVASELTVTPEPTETPIPTPVRMIPEEIVDTLDECYTYEEMMEDLDMLSYAYPDLISVTVEGYSADNRAIPAVRFGNPEAEQVVLIQAAIHGREYMTTLLVMKQLETYAKEYASGIYGEKTYQEIFSEVALVVVPMTNPDGVSVSQLGTESIRSEELRALVEGFYERDGAGVTREYFYRRYKANARGVDLNRNFAYGWEEFGGAAVPAADRYKGTAPGSEPETQVLMQLTEREPVIAAISYHATGSVLYWDFGQTGEIRRRCFSLVETVHELTGYRIVYAESEKQDEAGYCEWAVGVKDIPEVTIEIGTVAAPLPISQFENIFAQNKNVPVAVAELGMRNKEK